MSPLVLLVAALVLAAVDNLARRRLSFAEVVAYVLAVYALVALL